MAEHPIFWVGNRDPSISETITAGGVAVDLTGKTVRFKAREVGSSVLLVDEPVSNTPDTTGFVRYDWSADDIDTGGLLADPRDALVWWEVTSSGKTQDMNEAVIVIREHAPGSNVYVELEEARSTLELTSTFADTDLKWALQTASRVVDDLAGRRFYADPDATQVRYYTPSGDLFVDDIATFTSLATDNNADGTFETAWTLNSDFVLEPFNAAADGKPFNRICPHPAGTKVWPAYPRSVRVTAKFGWPAVPAAARDATMILANRFLRLKREAPFGVVALGPDGTAVRLAKSDPTVMAMIESLQDRVLLV